MDYLIVWNKFVSKINEAFTESYVVSVTPLFLIY